MKFVIVAQEMPYPPTHGGSADVWRRIRALKALGHDLLVVTWRYEDSRTQPKPEDLAHLAKVAGEAYAFPIRKTARGFAGRLPHLGWAPSHVAARVLSGRALAGLTARVRAFDPDVVLLDGLHACWLGRRLARSTGKPLLYRAHNREHHYLSAQRRSSRALRGKLSLALATLHLRGLERAVHAESLAVWDISQSDAAWWTAEGFANSIWLPPLYDPDLVGRTPSSAEIDLGYVGNLYAPNNVEGVLWFLDAVLPHLQRLRPEVRVVVAGSRPVEAIVQACARHPQVTLIPDVPDPASILLNARVLINPVWASSGVNIKMVDMLCTGAPVVSTSFGAAGLPAAAGALVHLADTAETFAKACDSLLGAAPERADRRAQVGEWFGPGRLQEAVRALDLTLSDPAASRG